MPHTYETPKAKVKQ